MLVMYKAINYLKVSLIFLSVFSFTAWAQSAISVSDGYIRATVPGTQISSAYMTIGNKSNSIVSLTSVTSKITPRIEIHEHTMSDGMMKMMQVDALAIPANGEVKLQPGGYHLMIFNLTTPLNPEENIDLTLHFTEGKSLQVTLPVKSIKPVAHHHHH